MHDVLTERMIEYRGITCTILEESSQKYTRLLVSSLGKVCCKGETFHTCLENCRRRYSGESGPDTVSLPKKSLLKRVANRTRANLRPEEPRALDFELNEDFITAPDFLVADIRVDGERHFLLATELVRTSAISEAVVLGKPFRKQGQLMSVHAFFIERNGARKQLPLVFCLMSRKTKPVYLALSYYVKSFFLSTVINFIDIYSILTGEYYKINIYDEAMS
ncbi:hypothetical protein CHS0354_016702 [Potamilus streckersoni]|uniref:Uncharacterized protein n=1 Tax=Potamilus streckersoni TaxID=2493646 RepID=A0AAE0TIA0_9BIVA|nr:hypothetical protein CHS0354_016702 [Potamilus streckersoni]